MDRRARHAERRDLDWMCPFLVVEGEGVGVVGLLGADVGKGARNSDIARQRSSGPADDVQTAGEAWRRIAQAWRE